MSRLLLLFSFICLAILAVGTALLPNNPIFWLASGGLAYEGIREALAFILFFQIFSQPPRNIRFRVAAGVLAASVALWALVATYLDHMMFLDSLSLLAAAFSISITAFEVQPLAEHHKKMVKA